MARLVVANNPRPAERRRAGPGAGFQGTHVKSSSDNERATWRTARRPWERANR